MIGERRADELWPGMRILIARGDTFDEARVVAVKHRRTSPNVTVSVVYDRDSQQAWLSMFGAGVVPLLEAVR